MVTKLGGDEPLGSMDQGGKVICAKNNEILAMNVKSLGDSEEVSRRLWRAASRCLFAGGVIGFPQEG